MRGRSHLWRVNKPPPHPHPPPRTSKLPHHPLSEDGEQTGVKKIAFPTPLSGVSCQVYRSFVSLCFDEQPVLMDKENRGTVGSPQRVRGECVRWGCCKWCSASDTWMGSMCTVTAAGTPVLIWRDASLMSWKLGYLLFFLNFCVQILLFSPSSDRDRKKSYVLFKAFKPDMRAGLRRPFCCIKMCEMWIVAKCHWQSWSRPPPPPAYEHRPEFHPASKGKFLWLQPRKLDH